MVERAGSNGQSFFASFCSQKEDSSCHLAFFSMSDELSLLLQVAGITPPADRNEALIAGMADLRKQAAIVRALATGEPATTFRVDPLG